MKVPIAIQTFPAPSQGVEPWLAALETAVLP
jgi:hypothetical protein